MRIQGTVIKFVQGWDFISGEIQANDGDKYKVVSSKDISADLRGRRFLEVGEVCEFDSSRVLRKVAKNITRPFAEKVDPHAREMCMVVDSDVLMRMVGGRLATDFGVLVGIPPGSIVSCKAVPSHGHSMSRAVDLRFVAESEADVKNWDADAAEAE